MPSGDTEGVLQIGEWIVNPSLDTISKGSEIQKLEPRTMRLLLCLAGSAGEVVSVDRLLTEVWTGVVVGSASVYQAVSQLRKLLGDKDPEPTYIATVPRKGYRLIAPVRRIEPAASSPDAASSGQEASGTSTTAALGRRSATAFAAAGIVLIALAIAGMIWKKSSTARLLSAATNSIVVLPFIDMTANQSDQSFCDGLTEELSSWLAQIPTLRVVARTSAFAFRGQGEDVRKIGKALDTSHVLEGSIRRSGDRMRITVQLIDAGTGYHLWSEDFDRSVDDAIKIQEDISRSVAGTLQVRLTSDSERQFALRRMADPRAYQLYLLARHYAQQLTPEATEREIDLYQQVLTVAPNFAPAYTQLAYARLNQGFFKLLPMADTAARVEPLIATALRLDSRLSAAYAVRGTLRSLQDRTKEALDDLQHAISLNPSDMPAFSQIGRIHFFQGQPRDALVSYDQAAALDPLNFAIQEQRCTLLADLARYEDAGRACERARTLQPGSASTADALAWLSESQGKIDDALKWNETALNADPTGDFELYWTRTMLFLSLGMSAPARAAVELGGRSTKNEEDANVALARVNYREGGSEALRRHLTSSPFEQSQHAQTLFEAAYCRLLLGEAAAAKQLIARARTAPDLVPGFAELPFYARTTRSVGNSYRLDLAVADLALGDRASAEKELNVVLEMLNKMVADGVERNATYELRARVYALKGQGDDAMKDLDKAVKHGWRRAWWATHEPYFASLLPRGDFQALMSEVERSNQLLAKNITARQ
jgi:TolB-like protein/DNA-binding winged helix-turn-helix (wHTH) protein/Tfp pilus assembly protein PilF